MQGHLAGLACLALGGAAAAQGVKADLRVVAPEAPLAQVCFAIDTPTHAGGVALEEIEGAAISGESYGTVTTADGESWGYIAGLLGALDGAFLTVEVQTAVEGDTQGRTEQWVFVEGGLVTPAGTYDAAACEAVQAEYIRRVTPSD